MEAARAEPATAPLRQQEAVLLAHALVARIAEQLGARVLFIKGPTAVAVGARPDRPSSDVDVLVEPAKFDEVCGAFESAGWIKRFLPLPLTRTADVSFDHSAHFIRDDWPCDLDVHFNFPGFLGDRRSVFEALWHRRTTVEVAGRPVTTPDLLGQTLIVALHALRDPDKATSRADLAHLAQALAGLDSQERAALSELAAETGSPGTAGPLLRGVIGGALIWEDSPDLRAWQVRQEYGAIPTAMWLVELRRTPWSQRVQVVRRALLPPRQMLLSPHLASTATGRDMAALHVRRWARAIRSVPRAIRVLGKVKASGRD